MPVGLQLVGRPRRRPRPARPRRRISAGGHMPSSGTLIRCVTDRSPLRKRLDEGPGHEQSDPLDSAGYRSDNAPDFSPIYHIQEDSECFVSTSYRVGDGWRRAARRRSGRGAQRSGSLPQAGAAREGQSDLHVQQARPRAAPLPVRSAGGEGRLLHELVRCDDDAPAGVPEAVPRRLDAGARRHRRPADQAEAGGGRRSAQLRRLRRHARQPRPRLPVLPADLDAAHERGAPLPLRSRTTSRTPASSRASSTTRT